MSESPQVSLKETERIISLAQQALAVVGDFVELGCYRGDTSIELARILKGSGKQLHLYDSFVGLPPKSQQDSSALGDRFVSGELPTSKADLIRRFQRAGLRVPHIKKAWFSNLNPADLPSSISFAFLDGDFYSSIRDSLKLVSPLMSDQGILVIHDYRNPALPGVAQAVDEWNRNRHQRLELYETLCYTVISR